MQCEREEIGISEPSADLSRPSSNRLGARIVPRRGSQHRIREHQEPLLGGFLLLTLQKAVRSREPTSGLREISFEQEGERHPENAARGPPSITGGRMGTPWRFR
jgi:hypothetical protein